MAAPPRKMYPSTAFMLTTVAEHLTNLTFGNSLFNYLKAIRDFWNNKSEEPSGEFTFICELKKIKLRFKNVKNCKQLAKR